MSAGRGFWIVAMLATMATAASAEPLTFCYAEWMPHSGTVDDKPRGISIEVLTEAARRAGYEATFQPMPWPRCVKSVVEGRVDGAVDGTPQDGMIHGRHSPTLFQNVFWVSEASEHKDYRNLEQFDGARLGLVTGFQYPEAIEKGAGMNVQRLPNDESLARTLDAARIDVAVADVVAMTPLVKSTGTRIRYLKPAYSVVKLYPSFHPSKTEAAARIDQALGDLLAEGVVDRIYQKCIGISFSDVRQFAPQRPAEGS